MTRRDYELIAAAIKEARQQARDAPTYQPGVGFAQTVLEARMAAQNPRFDLKRFQAACAVEPQA